MDMPRVFNCEELGCAYNLDGSCHALAITISDGMHPKCLTYWNSEKKGGDIDATAGVGACRESNCVYNNRLECQASQVCIGQRADCYDCLTFSLKQTSN